jgi:hypothetical protein
MAGKAHAAGIKAAVDITKAAMVGASIVSYYYIIYSTTLLYLLYKFINYIKYYVLYF